MTHWAKTFLFCSSLQPPNLGVFVDSTTVSVVPKIAGGAVWSPDQSTVHHEKLERKQRCVGDPPWVKLLANNSCRTGHRFWCPACLGYRSRQPSRGVKIWGKYLICLGALHYSWMVEVDFPLLISPSFLQKIGIFQRGFAANISQANRGARFAVGGFQRHFQMYTLEKFWVTSNWHLVRNQGLSKVQKQKEQRIWNRNQKCSKVFIETSVATKAWAGSSPDPCAPNGFF